MPDSLSAHTAPKTTILSRLFSGKKLKNRGTIIIQSGTSSVAASVGKSKAPIATATGEASASVVEKPKAPVALTIGNNSPATATTTKKDYSWLLYLLLAVATGVGLYIVTHNKSKQE